MTTDDLSSAFTHIGFAFANHIWQSTAFAAIIGLLTMSLRKHQARIRFSLWFAASIKFLVPFSLLIALGGLLPKPQHVTAGSQTPLYAAIDLAGQPFSNGTALPINSASQGGSLLQHLTAFLPFVLAGIWLFGAFVVLLAWFARWRQVSAILHGASPTQDGREVRLLRRLEEATGRRGGIALLLSPERVEPEMFGIFRPALIWPERLSERLEEEQMEAILAHEITHQRRHDNLTAAMHMLVEIVFWFHPMVWWMERRLVEERERACDEAVVRLGSRPEAYAEALLKACRFCVESPLVCVSGITGADLSRRVRSIMTLRVVRQLGLKGKLLLILAAAVVIAGPVAFGVVSAGQAPPVQPTTVPEWQTPASGNLSFDVVSVRQSKEGGQPYSNYPLGPMRGSRFSSGLFVARNMQLLQFLVFAYADSMYQIQGLRSQLPDWARTERFDIEARTSSDRTNDEMRQMVRSMLAERFGLKVHIESRKVSMLALKLSKPGELGPALKVYAASEEPCSSQPPPYWRQRGEPIPADQMIDGGLPAYCGSVFLVPGGPNGLIRIAGRGVTMAEVAAAIGGLANITDYPVVDRTGLDGKYDVRLEFVPQSMDPADASSDAPAGPSLQAALKKQLGLKMDYTKGSFHVIVIGGLHKVSSN